MVELLLFIVSVVLAIVIIPLGIIYKVIKIVVNLEYVNPLFEIAIAIDYAGNYICADLFNATLRQEGGYEFGHYETVSSALGKLQRDGKLSKAGKALCWILDTIDPNHCEKSIKEF
jgi:hypothetical protein